MALASPCFALHGLTRAIVARQWDKYQLESHVLAQIYIFGRAQTGRLTRYGYSFVIVSLREWTCVMNNLFCRRGWL